MRPFLRYASPLVVAFALAAGGRAQAGGFVFTTINAPGASTTSANGLNTFGGQIVGSYTDSLGTQHGFVAMSVPEPSTLVLSGIGAAFLVVLGLRQRRR